MWTLFAQDHAAPHRRPHEHPVRKPVRLRLAQPIPLDQSEEGLTPAPLFALRAGIQPETDLRPFAVREVVAVSKSPNARPPTGVSANRVAWPRGEREIGLRRQAAAAVAGVGISVDFCNGSRRPPRRTGSSSSLPKPVGPRARTGCRRARATGRADRAARRTSEGPGDAA